MPKKGWSRSRREAKAEGRTKAEARQKAPAGSPHGEAASEQAKPEAFGRETAKAKAKQARAAQTSPLHVRSMSAMGETLHLSMPAKSVWRGFMPSIERASEGVSLTFLAMLLLRTPAPLLAPLSKKPATN